MKGLEEYNVVTNFFISNYRYFKFFILNFISNNVSFVVVDNFFIKFK